MDIDQENKTLEIKQMIESICKDRDAMDDFERYYGILKEFTHLPLQLLEKRLIDGIEASKIPVKHSGKMEAEIISEEGIAAAGMNKPKIVTFRDNDGTVRNGFLKTNAIPYFNDASFAMEKIGSLLDIKVARNFEYDDGNGQPAIISENIANENEKFVSMAAYMKKADDNEKTQTWQDAQNFFKENNNSIERGAIPAPYGKKGRVLSEDAIEVLMELPMKAMQEKRSRSCTN